MTVPQEQPSTVKKNYSFSKYPLYSNETPRFVSRQNCPFVPCGNANDYPDYLAYLYNNSSIHGAIVKRKAKYIFGKGWKIKDEWSEKNANLVDSLTMLMNSINGYQTLDELSRGIIFERTLYGGVYYLIDWGTMGNKPISVTKQPFNTVRVNEDCTKFFVSKHWTKEMSTKSKWKNYSGSKLPEGTVEYPAFNIANRKGKQILFIKDDNPASDIYPLPEYESGKTRIETNIECGFFHLNNVKSGFSAGTMITFFNGDPNSDEAKSEISKAMDAKTSGTDNAGEKLYNFQDPNTTAPVISPLRSNDLDKQYEQLARDSMTDTLIAHEVTNPALFGIIAPSGFQDTGNTIEKAWELFANTYVMPKQQSEEEDINYIMGLYGFKGNPLELVVLDPISYDLTPEMVSRVVSNEDLRKLVYKKLGIEEPKTPILPNQQPIQQSKLFQKFQDAFILSKFLSIGVNADDYEIVFEVGNYDEFAEQTTEDKIISALKDKNKISVKDLAAKIGISENQVYKILDRLNANNTLAVKYIERGGEVIIDVETIAPEEPKGVELLTKWRYYGPQDSKNRDFCRQLLAANKLYDRKEIDAMENEAHTEGFNESVWRYKGGWYHDPARDVNLPACRHSWSQVIVRRKEK